jgi:hypothetical protein
MKSKQELVDLLWVRTGISRAVLSTKTVAELETILTDHHLAQIRAEAAQAAEAADEELIRIQAEREGDRILHQLHMQQAREPQRKAEDKRQLAEDRKTFLEACRQYHIGSTDANFSLIRTTLGPRLSVYEIGQAVRSGTLHLSPATQSELQQYRQEAAEQRQQFLRNADPETLRGIVRSEAEQRRIQFQREEDQRQLAARQAKDEAYGFPLLPEINASTGEKLNSAYFIRLSNTDLQKFKNYIRYYGASQITRALRERT